MRLSDVRQIGATIAKRATDGNATAYAAALSYSFILALFPLLLFLSALLGFWHVEDLRSILAGPAGRLIAPNIRSLIIKVTKSASRFKSPTLLSVGSLGFIGAMSSAMRQLMNALNHAYLLTRPRRTWWRALGISTGMGVLLGLLLVVAEVISILGSEMARWIAAVLLGRPHWAVTADLVQWALLLVLMWLVLTLIYNWLPDEPLPFRWLRPGTGMVIGLWIVISIGFAFYTGHFNYYDKTYGSLGGAILLLLYLYILSLALLLGGIVNAVWEDWRQPRSPSGAIAAKT